MIPTITIHVRGQNGTGATTFTLAEWTAMNSPIDRVLALHDRLRDITGGQPFDVLREEVSR